MQKRVIEMFFGILCCFVSSIHMMEREVRFTSKEVDLAICSESVADDLVACIGGKPFKIRLISDGKAWLLRRCQDELSSCYQITLSDWTRRVDSDLGELLKRFMAVHCTCDHCEVSPEAFAKIIALSNLYGLSLVNASIGCESEACSLLKGCQKLKLLELLGRSSIKEGVLGSIIRYESFERGLQVLSLNGCAFEAEKAAILDALLHYQSLQKLSVNETAVDEDDLRILSQSFSLRRSLKSLSVNHLWIKSIDSISGFDALEEVTFHVGIVNEAEIARLAYDSSILPNLKKIVLYHGRRGLKRVIIDQLQRRGIEPELHDLSSF